MIGAGGGTGSVGDSGAGLTGLAGETVDGVGLDEHADVEVAEVVTEIDCSVVGIILSAKLAIEVVAAKITGFAVVLVATGILAVITGGIGIGIDAMIGGTVIATGGDGSTTVEVDIAAGVEIGVVVVEVTAHTNIVVGGNGI